ncbi:hemerythrin domain-containing protein [Bacillus sp. FJAT-45350]|uniref:hemerythrin domain-containing protein n=1 Tax=Bacillus sp. FJAT-45350 TaxID=2011014 RepID=UPI00211C3975|nr:hemerythrin domain-containing protein [Bacillus sp. FJAT-45350]
METQPLSCVSSMLGDDVDNALCPALMQLKNEHPPLTKQMESIYALTQSIEQEEITLNSKALEQLYKQVKSFVTELEPHAEREEGVLFEMVAAYIGRTNGPIAVMEYEHDEAKKLLKTFLDDCEKNLETVEPTDIKRIASYTSKACEILTQHFMKEESVLFPLANKLLTSEEKEVLEIKINLV